MSPSLFKQDSPDGQGAVRPESRERIPVEPIEKSRRRRREEPGSISVLGVGIEVTGEIKARGDVQIEGRLKGDLTVEGQVAIQTDGSVEGDVRADRVIVAGRVDGSIEAQESARFVDGARVDADVTSPRVQLEDGATLNGRVDMGDRSKKRAKEDREEKQEPTQGAA